MARRLHRDFQLLYSSHLTPLSIVAMALLFVTLPVAGLLQRGPDGFLYGLGIDAIIIKLGIAALVLFRRNQVTTLSRVDDTLHVALLSWPGRDRSFTIPIDEKLEWEGESDFLVLGIAFRRASGERYTMPLRNAEYLDRRGLVLLFPHLGRILRIRPEAPKP